MADRPGLVTRGPKQRSAVGGGLTVLNGAGMFLGVPHGADPIYV